MYKQEQIEHSDFILQTMKQHGGRMQASEMAGVLHKKYNYAIEPELQLSQLIIADKLIIKEGSWLFLTPAGRVAAVVGAKRFEKKIRWTERLKRNADIATIGGFVGMLVEWLLRCL